MCVLNEDLGLESAFCGKIVGLESAFCGKIGVGQFMKLMMRNE